MSLTMSSNISTNVSSSIQHTSQQQQNSSQPVLDETGCSICLGHNNRELYATKCAHVFHKTCLAKWVQVHSICPLCKRIVSKKEVSKLTLTPEILLIQSIQNILKYPLYKKNEFLNKLNTALSNNDSFTQDQLNQMMMYMVDVLKQGSLYDDSTSYFNFFSENVCVALKALHEMGADMDLSNFPKGRC